jgi:dGTPase
MALPSANLNADPELHFCAPYAQFSSLSRGRFHPESEISTKPEYQRDRERIIHSSAFQALEHKSQIILNRSGDEYRTRLSHTLEVAVLGRSIARSLRLNDDLVDAIALSHDLGFPPFGQPGEHTLNQLMNDHGGFHHSRQSLRVVDELEMIYPEFNGLNLTYEVRTGLYRSQVSRDEADSQPSLEAQVVDASDELVSARLDLGDALEYGFIEEESLADIALWTEVEEVVAKQYSRMDKNRRRLYILDRIQEALINDLCRQSQENLDAAAPANATEARTQNRRLIGFSLEVRSKLQNLRDLLAQYFHHHSTISRVNQRACLVLQALFTFYHRHPNLIGDRAALKIKKEGLPRAVCDYLSGMTDTMAYRSYTKHLGTDSLLAELVPRKKT